MSIKFQSMAILSYNANELIRCSIREKSLNLDCDFNFRANLTGQMCYHLIGNPPGISPNPARV